MHTVIALAGVLGCSSPPSAPPPAPEPADAGLTAFEASLVEPVIEGVRAGVVPWNEEGIGVCRGTRTCEAFLGPAPGELPAGDYVLRAELRVPVVGTWKVVFESRCTPEGGEPVVYTRTYDVVAPGPDRPYRIGALRTIASPAAAGTAESCSWTLTAPHPDGDKVYQGAWSTP